MHYGCLPFSLIWDVQSLRSLRRIPCVYFWDTFAIGLRGLAWKINWMRVWRSLAPVAQFCACAAVWSLFPVPPVPLPCPLSPLRFCSLWPVFPHSVPVISLVCAALRQEEEDASHHGPTPSRPSAFGGRAGSGLLPGSLALPPASSLSTVSRRGGGGAGGGGGLFGFMMGANVARTVQTQLPATPEAQVRA